MSRNFVEFDDSQNHVGLEGESSYIKSQKPSLRQVENYSRKGSDGFANSLFQFEMKFDSLKGYVDSVTSAVNQHATLINKLRTDITSKSQDYVMTEAINKFASSLNLKDMESNFMITAVNEGAESKDEEKAYNVSVNKFCQKLEVFGNGMVKLNKNNENLNEKIGNMEISVAKKVGAAEVKAKVKKAKTKLRGEMENNNKKLDEKLKTMEKKYLQKIEDLEKKLCNQFKENQANNKIEGETHGNNKAVDGKDFEEKLRKDIQEMLEGNNLDIHDKLKSLKEDISHQGVNLKGKIQDMIANESVKFEQLENELLKQMNLKLQENSKIFENSLKEVQENVKSLNQQITDIEIISKKNNQNEDFKKLSEVEDNSRKIQDDIKEIHEKIRNIKQKLTEKVDSSELSKKLKKEETSIMQQNSSMIDEEKQNRLQKLVEELQQKIDKVNQNLDRKVSKLKKELDIDSLIKQFKTKADEDSVQNGFTNVDEKIVGLSHNFSILKKDLEGVVDSINKGTLQSGKSSSENPFITIKSALPKACLSCGQGGQTQLQTINPLPKKPEKVVLKEKSERPFTAASNMKARLFSTTMTSLQNNSTNLQMFGSTSIGFRHGSRSESVNAKH